MREIWIALGVMALCVGVFFTVQLGDSGSNAASSDTAPDASATNATDGSNPTLFANVAAESDSAEETETAATESDTAAPDTAAVPATGSAADLLIDSTTDATEEPALTTTESGLQYVDLVVGTGATPQAGQTVVVHYTGTLENGRKFDSSLDRNSPFSFRLGAGQVIKGWDEGLSTMQVGGKRKLVIPPELGYGSRKIGPIPANSTLIFEVELLRIAG
ncbi:MAG: FKBP-type peptidyl-prolyl cis-trans isomerase [Prochlorothrix sp.]|nr:FKBP-type peptidyl-prolyl cis-trans isomerase [Prochlorothrix sp.]